MKTITAPLGPKGQITLPKEIREALGIKERGDVVGFLLDEKSHTVKLTRMEIRPAKAEYTQEEIKKLMILAKEPGGKKYGSAAEFLKNLEKL